MLFRFQAAGFKNKVLFSKAGLWVPVFDALVPRKRNVLALLCSADGTMLIPASNIVTNDGDQYYAQRATGSESPTYTFGFHELASSGNPNKAATRASFTPIASTAKAHSSGYPKTNDGDAENTGGGVDIVTYLTQYAKSDFAASAITHGLITVSAIASTAAPILTGYAFAASFNKTSDDTLKLIVNHTMNGV